MVTRIANMTDEKEPFDWSALGEAWWREAAEQISATEKQAMFACAKYRGTSNTEAARQAGYAGDEDSIRQTAYRAFRTSAVQNLLALATSELRGATDGTVDAEESRRLLSKLARGSDPNVKIRAIEALQKLDERASELGRAVDDDGFGDWRLVRDYLQMSNGAAAIVHLWTGQGHGLSNFPLFHDVHKAIMQSDPDLWERIVRNSNASERVTIERQLSKPDWQIDARIKIWREIGTDITPSVTGKNGKVLATPSTSGNEQAVVGSTAGPKPQPANIDARG
jgi:hypothetical protein